MKTPKIRLRYVVVQPVFSLDDGETLKDIDHDRIVIPAEDWPTYSGERFPREVMEWQSRLDAEYSALPGIDERDAESGR
jgi:hypothetical protein